MESVSNPAHVFQVHTKHRQASLKERGIEDQCVQCRVCRKDDERRYKMEFLGCTRVCKIIRLGYSIILKIKNKGPRDHLAG